MKDISFDFYWILNEQNIALITQSIIDEKFSFSPDSMILDDDYSFVDGIEEFKKISNWQVDSSVLIYGEFNGYPSELFFNVFSWRDRKLIKLHIRLVLNKIDDFESRSYFLAIPALLCCFIYDNEDVKWQTEVRLENYERSGKSYTSLAKTKDRAGRTIIDTSENWGRSINAIHIRFLAASIMYFAEPFYKIIDKEIFYSFERVQNVNINNTDFILVELFDVFNDDIILIRNRQKAFLDHTKLLERACWLHENFLGVAQALNYLDI
ncbi:MAG: hypothetical protein J0H74_28265 [Chitinophagaceae bacterium]|nr:hypothetical protein [Chitinophagaceae bacterium]